MNNENPYCFVTPYHFDSIIVQYYSYHTFAIKISITRECIMLKIQYYTASGRQNDLFLKYTLISPTMEKMSAIG